MTPAQEQMLKDIHNQLVHIAGRTGGDAQHRYVMRDVLATLAELVEPYTYSDASKRAPALAATEAASAVLHGQTVGGAPVFLGRRLAEVEAKLDTLIAALQPATPAEG